MNNQLSDTDHEAIEVVIGSNENVPNEALTASIKELPIHQNSLPMLSKKQPPHLRAQKILKVQSPSDVLSPFSQKIMAERNSALKNLKPKSLTDTLLNARQSQLRQNAEESGGEEQASQGSPPSKVTPFQAQKIEHDPTVNRESD